jgi:membrane protein YdbS with pleckstrin-like domain
MLDRRVLTMWWALAGVAAAVALGAAVALAVADQVPTWVPIGVGVIAALLAAAVPYLRYRRWRYEIRERDVFLAKGALFVVVTLIPFDRIQFVETHQGPLDRAFSLTQLVIYTAAGKAGTIPGLESSEAEALREELSRVAGTESV